MRRDGMPPDHREALVGLLAEPRFEVLPLPGARRAAERLPQGSTVAVTADPEQTMADTIDLAADLVGHGHRVIPHLAAQLISNRRELEQILERMQGVGIDTALVVGGASEQPGDFFDASDLLDGLDELGHPLRSIGIGGYPEGHHVLDDAVVDRALIAKASRADWITTQICLDVGRLRTWLERIRSEGVDLPVWVGIPAVADLTGLMSFGLKAGAGRSLQFMFEHPRLVARLARPGGRAATRHVIEVAELARDESLGIAGFHLFTYNQVRAAERWRRGLLARGSQ